MIHSILWITLMQVPSCGHYDHSKWLQLAPTVNEMTPIIIIIDLIPAEALTALDGASILRKVYCFHSLPQHSTILTLTPRKVAHEKGKWKEKCENNSKIILKFSTPCYTETTKIKFVYSVENFDSYRELQIWYHCFNYSEWLLADCC